MGEGEKSQESVAPVDAASISGVEVGRAGEIIIDKHWEKSYIRKMDFYLLPYLSIMYFFNSVDRSNLANAETDGMSTDLHFKGQEYSLLVLLFYIPNGLCDLPLNLLTKRFSGKVTLPALMLLWGVLSMVQAACRNFAGLLVVRLLIGALEAGFFAGTVFYLTLFYTRGELGFRIAIFFGSALLAAAFSGLISFGVFRIHGSTLPGWAYLFLIEGGLTVILALGAFFYLPASPSTAWFLAPEEGAVARLRLLRDGSQTINTPFSWRECFATWYDRKFVVWTGIALTYPVAFSTSANFLPLILANLGYSTVITNLLTVPPNFFGFLVLLAVTYHSDRVRERSLHIVGALLLSLAGLILLAAVNAAEQRAVAYFGSFLLAAGAYIPSCLVHSWHNNNNANENARAATTGFLVGLGNLAGILSSATYRTTYAPRHTPMFVATAGCNVVCIGLSLGLGLWMRRENRRRDKQQGVFLRADDVDTNQLENGDNDPRWRYFY